MRTVAFCEIDPYCRAVLRKHWPSVPCFEDVRDLRGEHVGPVDVICGGFPCQDISPAGKRAGIDGERSGLWREFARLVGELRPRYVIVENSGQLLGRGLGRVLGDLSALGYDAEWHCIPASYVGAPHQRDRTWVIANPQRGERGQKPYGRALGRMGRQQQSFPWDCSWESALRLLRGVDDGSAYRVDRVDTLRNSVVPQIVQAIGEAIREDYEMKLLGDCVASLAGYRREMDDHQPCDAEKAATAHLEASNG